MPSQRDGLLLLAAVASGAAALGYELLWTRLLALSLGSETMAVLGAMAGYFAGMAAGAWLLHDRAARAPDPARLFARLELFAAGFAVLSPHLLHALARVVPALLGEVASEAGPGTLLADVAVAALTLLLGSAPLGATLAALAEARRRACPEDQDARGLGRLYAANTLGSTLGTLGAVYLVYPALGYGVGALVPAGLGVAAALLARRWARGVDLAPRPAGSGAQVDTGRDPDPDLLRETWLLYLAAFWVGVTGIGLQVVGVRVLGQNLENTIYTFAHILAVVLVGSALGGWIYQRLAPRAAAGRPAGVALGMIWTLGALIVVAALALSYSPDLVAALAGDHPSFGAAALAELAVAALVFLPSATVMGALLSHLIGMVAATGRGVGKVYALNTLGCALAPFGFGLWAIPRLGYADALYLVLYAYVVLFGLFGWLRRFSPALLVGGALGAIALTAAGPRSLALLRPEPGWKTLEQRETLHGLVAVLEREGPPAAGAPPLRRLQVGLHFRMGGAFSFGERRMGQLCAMLAHASGPEGPVSRALYLGLGTGATMGGALAVPHAAADGVELVPEVIEMLRHFEVVNGGLAARPEARLHAADARRFVAAERGAWSLVTADLFHPGQDGAGGLYARDHFAAVRDHLRPGGLFCQWLPLYQLGEDDARTIARGFLDVFPETHAFLGLYNAQQPALALVGRVPDESGEALRLDAARLSADAARADMTIVDARDLLASYLLGPAALSQWAGGGPRNTDLQPRIAFDAAEAAYRDDPGLGARNLADLLARAGAPPRALVAGEGGEALAASATIYAEAARHYLRGELARAGNADLSAMSAETAEHYALAYEADPEFAPARGSLYALVRENPTLAATLLPRMLARTPDEPRVYRAYLQHLRAAGDETRFQALLQEAQAKFPSPPVP